MAAPSVPDLALLVPCLNEAERIGPCLDALARWAAGQPQSTLAVVIDDGSTDGTAQVALAWRGALPVRVLAPAPGDVQGSGKGAALRRGVAAAPAHEVVFLDADLAVAPDHLDALLDALRRPGVHVAVGSRLVPGAEVATPQGAARRWMGRVYLATARRLLGLAVRDVTCGFKAFRGPVARDLFARCRAQRWGLDAELLLLARRQGLHVVEVPVTWRDGGRTRVRLLRDVPGSFLALVSARWRHRHVGVLAPAAATPREAPSEAQ